jgi:hypothetical protein
VSIDLADLPQHRARASLRLAPSAGT